MIKTIRNEIFWTALYVRAHHEKKVYRQLIDKHIESYLPLKKVLRQWSDRKKWIEEPLFRCYIFIRTHSKGRLMALQTYGAVRIISFHGCPAIVRDKEIEFIRQILKEYPTVEACTQGSIGDVVEIIRGPLVGLQGRLYEMRGQKRMVVTIESIHQSLHFTIDSSDLRIIKS
jgi:transcription antitermination factor NusG